MVEDKPKRPLFWFDLNRILNFSTHFLVTKISRLSRVASRLCGTNMNSTATHQHSIHIHTHTHTHTHTVALQAAGVPQQPAAVVFLTSACGAGRQLFLQPVPLEWLHGLVPTAMSFVRCLLRPCGSGSQLYHVVIRAKTNPHRNIRLWFPNWG